jgi:CubicO group peptidase (beta-lactamase class C family)
MAPLHPLDRPTEEWLVPWLSLVILCALLWSPGARADRDVQPLLDRIEALRREHAIPGAGMAIVSRDKILWAGGFGVMNLETGQPVTADTIFRIGSVTKMFTALGLIMLDEEGKLRLDGPVREFAPDTPFVNPHERAHPVTVAQLLEHTAGLQDLTKAEFDHSDPKPLTLEEGLAFAPGARTVRWQPGLHAVYSNAGYGLAGYVLQTVAKMRYEDFIGARIFRPLGMTSSGFFLDDRTAARLATGYATDAVTPLPYWHMLMRPFGGINSTPRDMACFVRLLLNDGGVESRRLVHPESISRMEVPRTSLAARNNLLYGYGLGNNQKFRKGVLFNGHGGDADGYLSQLGYNRDTGMGYFIVISAFRHRALSEMRREIESWIIRGLGLPHPIAVVKPDDSLMQRFVGDYELAAWRFPWTTREEVAEQAMRVTLENGALYSQIGTQQKQELLPVGLLQFRRHGEPTATCAFVEDGDGALYFEEDESWRKRGTGPLQSQWPGAIAAP